jgi:uncharacterized protein (DUF2062 family)
MRDKICEQFRSLLRLSDPPHKLALAFSLGIFIAFSPTIGLHMISCLVFAWIFRVSKVVVITASFVNNPWTAVPLYGFCLWFGMKITGSAVVAPHIDWSSLNWKTAYLIIKPYLWPFVAGTLVLGTVSAVLSYGVSRWAVVRYRKKYRQELG